MNLLCEGGSGRWLAGFNITKWIGWAIGGHWWVKWGEMG